MKCPKTTDDRDDLVLDVQCGSNTALVHLSKLRQGSRAASVLFEGRWLSPNQFQCVSGRRTTKDWKRSIRHHGKTLRQLMGQGVLTVDPPACDCATCKGNATKENMSPDVARVAAKAHESVERRVKDDATVATPGDGSVVTVAATKGAVVVSALLDKTRDTQQCARAMVVELPRRGDSKERKTQHKQAKADLADNEKPQDIVTSTTTPESQRSADVEPVQQVARGAEKTDDGAGVPDETNPSAVKEEGWVTGTPTTEARSKEVVVTAATSFTDMFKAAQRSSGVSPHVSCDVTSAVSSETGRAVNASMSQVACHDVMSPKTGSDRHTPEARLPCLNHVIQDADKHRVTSVDCSVSEIRPLQLDALGMNAPNIYQFRASLDNIGVSSTRLSLVEGGHECATVASREQAVTATTSVYSGLMTASMAVSSRLADTKRDHNSEKKTTDDGKNRVTTSLGNSAKKPCSSREKSSTTTPSGDNNRGEKRASTSADEFSPEKRQRHSAVDERTFKMEYSPKHVTNIPEFDAMPKHARSRTVDLKASLNPWSELAEKSSYLGGVGIDWPLARSLYATLPYSSPAASLPGYCTGLCCNPYLGHVPGMPLLCGSTCQQPFCFSCYPMLPTKPLHGCLGGSLRQTLPAAAVTPCGMLCPSHPLGYGTDPPQDTFGYLKLHELAGLAPSYGLASDALAQSLAATAATSPARRRHGSTEAGQRSKTKRKCGDVTLVERPLDLSVRN